MIVAKSQVDVQWVRNAEKNERIGLGEQRMRVSGSDGYSYHDGGVVLMDGETGSSDWRSGSRSSWRRSDCGSWSQILAQYHYASCVAHESTNKVGSFPSSCPERIG